MNKKSFGKKFTISFVSTVDSGDSELVSLGSCMKISSVSQVLQCEKVTKDVIFHYVLELENINLWHTI